MATHFTADMHVDHAGILKWRPQFKSLEHMRDELRGRWNDTVSEHDEVFILGDVCMGTIEQSIEFLSELNGHLRLVPGNHDRMHPAHPDFERHKKSGRLSELIKRYEQHVTIMPLELEYLGPGVRFHLCHFPFEGDHTVNERYAEYRPADKGMVLLHGHVHDKWKQRRVSRGQRTLRMINVGVDVRKFTPVGRDELLELASRLM